MQNNSIDYLYIKISLDFSMDAKTVLAVFVIVIAVGFVGVNSAR